jgi:hypothetical protein
VSGGTIKNLNIQSGYVYVNNNETDNEKGYAGAIAGYLTNNSTINFCTSGSNIVVYAYTLGDPHAGGIAGYCSSGSIVNYCGNYGNIFAEVKHTAYLLSNMDSYNVPEHIRMTVISSIDNTLKLVFSSAEGYVGIKEYQAYAGQIVGISGRSFSSPNITNSTLGGYSTCYIDRINCVVNTSNDIDLDILKDAANFYDEDLADKYNIIEADNYNGNNSDNGGFTVVRQRL